MHCLSEKGEITTPWRWLGDCGKKNPRGIAIRKRNYPEKTTNFPLPGFDQYGMGLYPSYDTSIIAKELQLNIGTVSTGNSLDLLEKDMEAAAIAWVCRTLSVPMFAVKAITYLIDEETPSL